VNSFSPNPVNVVAGDPANVTVNVTPSNGTIDRVDWTIDSSAIATISPTTDASLPYQTVVTGVAPGTTTLRALVYMGGVLRCGGAAPVDPVNVSNPGPWWQVIDGDVITNGDVVSPIPGTCILAACDPVFIKEGLGNSPGIPLFAGSYDFASSGASQGTVSDSPPWGWKANSNYSAITEYKYAFYDRLVPGDAVIYNIAASPVTTDQLNTLVANSPDGYKWYFRTGALTLQAQALAANKVILFVAGDLTIDGVISLTDGTGFFMAISSGNITVNSNVTGAGAELEGIYVADNNFVTATDGSDDQLNIRGMVAAYGAADPNRNLPNNTQAPSEVFEYAPDLLFNYPTSLTLKRTRWKEITP
jgi:hypothetical protein